MNDILSELRPLLSPEIWQYSAEILVVHLAQPRSLVKQSDLGSQIEDASRCAVSYALYWVLYFRAVAERPDISLDLVE